MPPSPPMDDKELRDRVLDVLEPDPDEVAPGSRVVVRQYVAAAQEVVGELVRRVGMK